MAISPFGRFRFLVLLAAGAAILPLAFFASGFAARTAAPQDRQTGKEASSPSAGDASILPADEPVTADNAADLSRTIAKRVRDALGPDALSPELLDALERDVPLAMTPIMLANFEDYHQFMTSAGLKLGKVAEASVDEELKRKGWTEEEAARVRTMPLVERVEHLWKKPEIRGAAWAAISTESILAKSGYHNAPWPRWGVVGGRMSIYEMPEGPWHRHKLAEEEKEPVVTVRFRIRFTTSGTTWIDFQFIHLPIEGIEGGRWTPLGVFFAPPSGTWPRPLL